MKIAKNGGGKKKGGADRKAPAVSEGGKLGKKEGKASSLKHAAGLLGVDPSMLKNAKKLGCPGFDSHNRVDLAQVRDWLADPENAAELELGAGEKERLEIRMLRRKCDDLDFAAGVTEGQFVAKAWIVGKLNEVAGKQTQLLRAKLENEWPKRAAERAMGRLIDAAVASGADREKLIQAVQLQLPALTSDVRTDAQGLIDEIFGQMQELSKVFEERKESETNGP